MSIEAEVNAKTGNEMTVAEALRQFPELIDIVRIRDAGWLFRTLVDHAGELCGLVGTCHRQRYTDAVWVFGLSNVVGVRVLDEEYGGGMVWKCEDGLTVVIQELLALPEPGHRLAPRLVRASSLLWAP